MNTENTLNILDQKFILAHNLLIGGLGITFITIFITVAFSLFLVMSDTKADRLKSRISPYYISYTYQILLGIMGVGVVMSLLVYSSLS